MKTVDNQLVKIPAALVEELQAAAQEECRTRDDVAREAVERYLRDRQWQRLLSYGEQQARSLGLSETEVPRLIEEYRRHTRAAR